MSYEALDATIDMVSEIDRALHNSDAPRLRELARVLKRQDEDEEAGRLYKIARDIETNESCGYDRIIED